MSELLKIDFDDIEKIELIGGKKAKTLINAVSGYSRKPDYVFNACHFDNAAKSETYGLTISDTIVDKQFINGGNYGTNIYTNQGIAFNDNGDMKFCTTEEAINENFHSFIGGSPHLIKDGIICNEKLSTSFGKQKTYRIGIGFNSKELIVAFPNQKDTLIGLATYMKNKGANFAVALDGGGSVNVRKLSGTKYVHIDELNQNRAVSTFVCIWLKKNQSVVEPVKTKEREIPTHDGKKAVGVYEVTWNTVNKRVGAGIKYALLGSLKKGDRVTIFEQNGTWGKSYGYWISMNSLKLVKEY